MAYARQTWADGSSGGTPLSAARLNNIEAGLAAAAAVADAAAAAAATEAIQDLVAAMIKAGSNMTLSYDDPNGTLTLNSTAGGTGGTGTDPEVVRDTIGAALVAGTGIQITVNDPGDTITIAVSGLSKSTVGLSNVDNTADVDKPVSTAQGLTLAPKSMVEAIVFHDGSTGGGTRPSGYARVRWVGGTARPTNMNSTVDIWERDA